MCKNDLKRFDLASDRIYKREKETERNEVFKFFGKFLEAGSLALRALKNRKNC